MTTLFVKIRFWILYLLWLFLLLSFLFGWKSYAANDLLRQVFNPTDNGNNSTIIDLGENAQAVWNKVIKWWYEASIGWSDSGLQRSPSIVVRVTKLLLILTIALSITMILYNGLTYIIKTWQWEEWKNLVKNVLLVAVWILVSLFSVVIINLIQSIPTTIDKDLIQSSDNQTDSDILKWKKMSWHDVRSEIHTERHDLRHPNEKKSEDNSQTNNTENGDSSNVNNLEDIEKEMSSRCKSMSWEYYKDTNKSWITTYRCEYPDWTQDSLFIEQ